MAKIDESIAAKLREYIQSHPRPDMQSPLEFPDSGMELCLVCQHKRSELDGSGLCFPCCMYLFLKEDGKIAIVATPHSPDIRKGAKE